MTRDENPRSSAKATRISIPHTGRIPQIKSGYRAHQTGNRTRDLGGSELVRPVRSTVYLSCIIHFQPSTATDGAQCIIKHCLFPQRSLEILRIRRAYTFLIIPSFSCAGSGRQAKNPWHPQRCLAHCRGLYFSQERCRRWTCRFNSPCLDRMWRRNLFKKSPSSPSDT